MRIKINSQTCARSLTALVVIICLLGAPIAVLARKGEKNFKRGMQHEAAQQWEKAAQEYALAIAAEPSDAEYQLHYRRALFNASQTFMQRGRALAEQQDYVGAYNAFRQAYGYDPVNQLALSEMERMLRLQREKEGLPNEETPGAMKVSQTSYPQTRNSNGQTNNGAGTPSAPAPQDNGGAPTRTEQLRVINYNGDLKSFIRSLAEQLNLNVVFDSQSFRQPRTIDVNWRDVTTARALDFIFQQENLFFQKLDRRTILVADQTRRPQYQQLVLRTFYLSNTDPKDAQRIIQAAIPAQAGRPQTIVIPDAATNSLTVRDTSENVQLIGDLIRGIDKDRAEVVMDVNIYEVSRTDLLQFGNQIGQVDSNGNVSVNLGGSSGVSILKGSREVAQQVFGGPTALGAAFIIPPSVLTAFQRKNNTRLLASTQIHAFTGEESSARIGQRVPVQTAQTYPFSNVDTKTSTSGAFPGGGFPVINYEPTGLTLKFTPQVFPNLDVQVKMSIESKDVLNGSLTPTFTERTITGTARIQNNRTMLLASVAQDKESRGRAGLPLLGLIPIIGRIFSTPVRDNQQTDIVIAVTPRVLRAPAVTPEDEAMRPSGTLQTPTTGSLEAMIHEAEREEQLAAARRIPKNVVVQIPANEEPPAYVPAPKALMPSATNVSTGNDANASAVQTPTVDYVPAPVKLAAPSAAAPSGASTSANKTAEMPAALPRALNVSAPSQPATQPALSAPLKNDAGGTSAPIVNVVEPPPGATVETKANSIAATPAELRLIPERQEMQVGEKRRLALVLKTDAALGMAVVTLRFDPRTIAIRSVNHGNLFASATGGQPAITQTINPGGVFVLSIAPPAGGQITGAGVLLYVDIEALAQGESVVSFDKDNMHLIAYDGRPVSLQLVQSLVVVK